MLKWPLDEQRRTQQIIFHGCLEKVSIKIKNNFHEEIHYLVKEMVEKPIYRSINDSFRVFWLVLNNHHKEL